MNSMRKGLLHRGFFLTFLLSLLCSANMFASHYAAGDIYVDYIGTGPNDLTYKVTVKLYRACQQGATFGNPIQVAYVDTCNGVAGGGGTITCDTVGNGAFQVVAALCPNFFATNSCASPGSQWPAFEQWTYTGTVTLPYRCENWTFSTQNCCRNTAIANIAPNGMYIDCHVNNLFRFNINSPRFTSPPFPYMCINQLNNYANGPVDPDNDSLVTINVCPISSCCPLTLETYSAGYSLSNPINQQPSPYTYSVNANSGIATFTPSNTGFFVLAFCCKKYDRATKQYIGHCWRDVQVSVLACTSPPPTIDSAPQLVNGTGALINGILTICPGTIDSFKISGHSASQTNNIYLSLVAPYPPGVSLYVPTTGPNAQGTANPQGTFVWNAPTNCDIGFHTIIIKALDSTCTATQPILSDARFAVVIQVIDGIRALPKTYSSCVFSKPVTLSVSGLTSLQYQWTNYGTTNNSGINNPNTMHPSVHPIFNSKYVVHAPGLDTVKGCKSWDTVTVTVDTSTHVKIVPIAPATLNSNGQVVLCKPGILGLQATGSGTYPLTNPNGCHGTYATPVPTTALDSTDIVPQNAKLVLCNTDKFITPFGPFRSERHQYLVKAKDMINSGMKPGTIKALTLNVANYPSTAPLAKYYNVNIYIACSPVSKLSAVSTPIPAANIAAHYDTLIVNASGDLYLPFDTNYNAAKSKFWDWDTTKDVMIDICYNNNLPYPTYTPGPTNVAYYSTNYGASIFNVSNANTCGVNGTWGSPLFELPKIRFTYYYATAANFEYQWTTAFGDKLIADTTTKSTELWIQHDSNKYYAYTEGLGGCVVGDSITVVLDHPPAWSVSPIDTAICAGRTTFLYAHNGTSYKWFQGGFNTPTTLFNDNMDTCSICETPNSLPADTTNYSVEISDRNGCKDTFYTKVNVIPLPNFHVTYRDTTIKYGQSLVLGVNTGVYNYVWSPISSLDNPYNTNPLAMPWQPTQYVVVAFNGNCSLSDTVNVNIDYGANLYVPSGFTPNHDGKNDVFRVGNLTFQKIIEFRVLNRWGNEVFHALDNHGWDGTANGVMQDMGTYFYLIRVESLDGTEQTFQGEVTLIR